jgi:hypothetical protein
MSKVTTARAARQENTRAAWQPELDRGSERERDPLQVQWDAAVLEACARFGVTRSALRDSRAARPTLARFAVWTALRGREPIGWSLQEIARFGKRDVSTVREGIRVFAGRVIA